MLHFQTVRTARFTFTLKELTNADSRTLLNIPPEYTEKLRSEFIKRALKELNWHKGWEDNTLDDLTVQERLMIESTYLATVSDTPDFLVGNGNYSDYIQFEKQYKHAEITLGNIPDDEDIWLMRPLTGLMCEAVENTLLAKEKVERFDWILWAMAAQLYRKQDELPDPKADYAQFNMWLEERAIRLSNLPASAFNALLTFYFQGLEQLEHLFKINFDEDGINVFPLTKHKQNEEGEEYVLIPARFHPYSKIDDFTKKLFGKFAESSE
ncbi:hypothetical protein ACWIUH_01455 [Ursidibacter arcticus]